MLKIYIINWYGVFLKGVFHHLQALSMVLLVLEEQDVVVGEATDWKQDQMVVVAGLTWTRESTKEEAVDLPIIITMVHLISQLVL